VPARPYRLLSTGLLKPHGLALVIEPFALPTLSVELFDPKRPKTVSDTGGERPFLLGPTRTQPGSLRGWHMGMEPLFKFAVRQASTTYAMLKFKDMCAEHHLPPTLPAQPALWGGGLARLDAECERATALRVFGREEEQHWVIDRGPAWQRPAPPRNPPAHRREERVRTERDWSLDPLADVVQAEAPLWAQCWQDLRDTSLRRPHRSTVFLLLHGALPTNGMALVWRWRRDSFCPHSCCTSEEIPQDQWPVETYTHAFLRCPVAQAVTVWLVRIMRHMDGTEPPRTAEALLLGSRDAWTPQHKDLQWIWLHLRVACIHHLFAHRDAVALRRHPSTPFAVVGAVIADMQSSFLMDQRRLSADAYQLPGVCADWLRGRRKLFTRSDFNARWMHRDLASGGAGEQPRFRLSMHAPVALAACLPAGVAFDA
jgi:hypothetical protein